MSGKPDIKTQVTDFAKKRWADFQGFSPGQKAVTVFAVLALAIGGYFLATWKSEPAYAPLYSNLAATDASSIVDKLNSQGIPYKLTDGGAGINVPVDQVDTARLAVSAAGLPNSGQTGYALLDKEGVTTSQFKQQVDYQRAVEGELAKTIQSIQGVQAASVHLAIPQEDVFNDGTSTPTAAVLLTVSPGTQLTASQVQSVVYLVSSSVQGMKTGNVTVTDSNGNVLNSPDGGMSGAVNTATQAKAAQDYNTRTAAQLQSAIDASLGTGHAKVIVNATLNFDKSTTKTNKYLYQKGIPPVSESKKTEKYAGTGGTAGGTAGTNTDTNGTSSTNATSTGNGNGNGYDSTEETKNNALGTQENTTETAPGAVQNQHIAVMLDDKAKGLDTVGIQNLVKSAVGYDAKRGDTLSVEAMPFDTSALTQSTQAAKAAAAQEAAAKSHDQMISLIKQGVFGALLLALVVGTWLASRKRRGGAPVQPEPVDDGPDLMDDLMPATEPEPPVRAFPAAVQSDESERAAERRRELVRAADNRPAEVAHLLSGWLSTKEN
ncbi:flagellar M-ring protein FliF [Jatrophihabitans endophyticus]|uniref:Flagellar M-ring protein n=1 Tax=Jatrophihabitans endophyticus TaxID=1206085 RepID=A0A1M5IEZ0_9ACTN|nr:flagellar basal-body MS-ring/collar protein FliF [Jatrophihabitans endophyticus]SHG26908.1 flagellar M-ring protein FliF [Jatrophihabitans endophyticus]